MYSKSLGRRQGTDRFTSFIISHYLFPVSTLKPAWALATRLSAKHLLSDEQASLLDFFEENFPTAKLTLRDEY